jgi:Spy/CpxP family protein refolding chaperone
MQLRSLILAGFISSGLMVAAVQACPGMGGPEMGGPGARGDKIFSKLDLSDAQEAQIKTLREQMQNDGKDLHVKLRELRQQEMALLDTYDEKTARTVIAEKADIMQKLDFMRLNNMQQVNAVLTTEQKDKLKKMMAKRMEKMKKEREDAAE